MRETKVEEALSSHTSQNRYSGFRGLPRCVVFDECNTLAFRCDVKEADRKTLWTAHVHVRLLRLSLCGGGGGVTDCVY